MSCGPAVALGVGGGCVVSGDSSVDQYLSLRPVDFPVLVSLCLRQEYGTGGGIYGLSLRVELRAAESSDARRLVLSFFGVAGLRLDLRSGGVVMLSPLAVYSIRDRGWEELGYEVRETEQDDRLSFLCREFSGVVELE